jgi:hypothetical protein
LQSATAAKAQPKDKVTLLEELLERVRSSRRTA